jgi:hypothetical protein
MAVTARADGGHGGLAAVAARTDGGCGARRVTGVPMEQRRDRRQRAVRVGKGARPWHGAPRAWRHKDRGAGILAVNRCAAAAAHRATGVPRALFPTLTAVTAR